MFVYVYVVTKVFFLDKNTSQICVKYLAKILKKMESENNLFLFLIIR